MTGRKLLVLLTTVLALIAAGCGGKQSPAVAVSEASAKTTEEGSAKVSIETTTRIPESMQAGGQSSIDFSGEGSVDYENGRGQMTLDLSDMGAGGGPQVGEMEMVFEGTMVYMQFDLLQQQLPEGKSWVKFDLATIGEEIGVDVSQFAQFSNNDPAAALKFLEGASSLEETGTEEVRGEETTHYEGTVDLEKVAEESDDEDFAQAIKDIIDLADVKRVPLEVWVDGDGLVRRTYVETETPAGSEGESVTSEITTEFYDFGTDVDFEVPADAETIDLQELIGAGAGE